MTFTPPFEHVRLRPLDDISPDQYRLWQNDPTIRDLTLGFRFPVQSETVQGWLQTRLQRNGRHEASFSIFYQDSGVGACFLRNIDWINSTSELSIYLGTMPGRGKGVGYCACALLLDYAFLGLNLRRISLEVLADNAAALRLYERLGFRREGLARGAILIGGRPKDVIRFGLLAGECDAALPKQAHRLIAPDVF